MLGVTVIFHATVVATTKVVNFKQITTTWTKIKLIFYCCCYHKGS